MKKLLLIFFITFCIKADLVFFDEKDIKIAGNYLLESSILDSIKNYKVPIADLSMVLELIIDKMYKENDIWGLRRLRNRLEKMRDKDNEYEINKLDFLLFKNIELVYSKFPIY